MTTFWPLFFTFFHLKVKKIQKKWKKQGQKKVFIFALFVFCHFFSFQKVNTLLKMVRAQSRRFAWADWSKIWQKMTRFLTKIAKKWNQKKSQNDKILVKKWFHFWTHFLKSWPDFWPLFWQKHRLLPSKSGSKSGDKKWTKIFLFWKKSSLQKIFKKSKKFGASKMVTRIFEKRTKTDQKVSQFWSSPWSVGPRETANFHFFAKKSELFFEKISFGHFWQNCQNCKKVF